MKKILSIVAGLILAVSAFATGNEGVNPPQTGVFLVSNALSQQTNTFAFPFQTPPLVIIYSSLTNGTPTTNVVVTTTNFVFSFPAGTATNSSFYWQAYVGGTRMESGTATNGVASPSTSIAFPYTYATPPIVVMTPFSASTNVINYPVVLTVGTTNFTYSVNGGSTNFWIAVGTVANPQSENVGANPPSNKVIY